LEGGSSFETRTDEQTPITTPAHEAIRAVIRIVSSRATCDMRYEPTITHTIINANATFGHWRLVAP
jgi:hypothetical protein